MDFIRLLFCLIFIFFSSLTFAFPTNPHLGIAFIHGTNDHREDADGGYWKKEFIDYLANSLIDPENNRIVACDFTYYMWEEEAAGCVANQLLTFINNKKINDLVVYTHSNGANVIRWILSHPTYDQRYFKLSQTISEVIALSPSSGGTRLADDVMDGTLFQESVGWLLGYRNNSVKQQRVGDMALFNDELLLGTPGRLPIIKPFRTVVSSDVYSSPFSSYSYCNGYFTNLGLSITKLYLEQCSDGFLNCASQSLAGNVWFKDTEKTTDGIALSHNQSRHSCFGLERILSKDLILHGVAQ